jgi:hypothetical protein
VSDIASTSGWAVRLDLRDASRAASLRRIPGISSRLLGDGFWLRGSSCDAQLANLLTQLPATDRYLVDPQGLATRQGCLLPTMRIPDAGWTALSTAFALSLDIPALPGAAPERHPLRLIRSHHERAVTALVCAWDAWAQWSDEAPAHRLKPLRFTRSGDQSLVLGDPLPPLPGQYHHLHGAVILPAGHDLDPLADPAMLREIFRLSAGDYALVHLVVPDPRPADGNDAASWELIPASAIASADRATVRATHGDESRG